MKKIPTIAVWTDNFYPMYKRWRDNLPECFECLSKMVTVSNADGNCGNEGWYVCIRTKLEYLLDYMRTTAKPGEILLCSDVDLMFRSRDSAFGQWAVKKMNDKARRLDLLIMREGGTEGVNGGFYFIRNKASMRKYIEGAISIIEKRLPYADQEYFNDELNKGAISWDFIPSEYVVWGNLLRDAKQAVFHHAVCATTMVQKISQQNRIAKLLGMPALKPMLYPHRQAVEQWAVVVSRLQGGRDPVEAWGRALCAEEANVAFHVYNKAGDDYVPAFVDGVDVYLHDEENVGRDMHAYLSFVVDNFDDLPEVCAFVSDGDLEDVVRVAVNTQHYVSSSAQDEYVRQLMHDAYANGKSQNYVINNRALVEVNRSGKVKYHNNAMVASSGLMFGQWFEKWFGYSPPSLDKYTAYYKCAFALRKDFVQAYPKSFYEAMRDELARHRHPEEAHFASMAAFYVFEKAWYRNLRSVAIVVWGEEEPVEHVRRNVCDVAFVGIEKRVVRSGSVEEGLRRVAEDASCDFVVCVPSDAMCFVPIHGWGIEQGSVCYNQQPFPVFCVYIGDAEGRGKLDKLMDMFRQEGIANITKDTVKKHFHRTSDVRVVMETEETKETTAFTIITGVRMVRTNKT